MTIHKNLGTSTRLDVALALRALAWILQDDRRAMRFLDLTGLTPDRLRDGIADSQVHEAILEFLCAHEPDLVAAAEALGVSPDSIAAGRREQPS